jgi:hypothetical protein
MAQTNANKVKKIEKKFNVKLEFYYLDTYGYYCKITDNKTSEETKCNVYDDDIILKSDRKFFINVFLTETIFKLPIIERNC